MPEFVTPRELSTYYNPPGYTDSWACVQDYQEVQNYRAEHPDAGRTKVGNALDLPPSRVRGWLNDSKPDCVHAIHTAIDKTWIPGDPNAMVFRGLNGLNAWIFASGSIDTHNYVPQFVTDTDSHTGLLQELARLAGTTLTESRDSTARRAQEYRPNEYAGVLGRVLAVLDAPVGEKSSKHRVKLPYYLHKQGTPFIIKQEWVQIYTALRGVIQESGIITLREERPTDYLRRFAHFASRLTNASVQVSEYNIIYSKPATRTLLDWSDSADILLND